MKKIDFRDKRVRIALGIAVPVILLLGALFLYYFRSGPPCIFYKLTGLYCTGCGTGRAAVAILHGDLLAAFGYNPLSVILAPFVAYYLLKVYIAYVFGRDLLPFFKVERGTLIAVLVIMIAFTVLRNIPVDPFVYLAP